MKHKFQDPYFEQLAKRLVTLDTAAKPRPKFQTIKAFFGDNGIDLDKSAREILVDLAHREATRRGLPEATNGKKVVFHPVVLKQLLSLVTPERSARV